MPVEEDKCNCAPFLALLTDRTHRLLLLAEVSPAATVPALREDGEVLVQAEVAPVLREAGVVPAQAGVAPVLKEAGVVPAQAEVAPVVLVLKEAGEVVPAQEVEEVPARKEAGVDLLAEGDLAQHHHHNQPHQLEQASVRRCMTMERKRQTS